MRSYLLDHVAEDVRKKIVKARIEQVDARAKEIEAMLEAVYMDQEKLGESNGVKGFSLELYDAMHAMGESIFSGADLLIRADNEIAPRLLKDLTIPKGPGMFAACITAHMFLPDEDVRARLEHLSKDGSLEPESRKWFAWAIEHAKSND